MWYSIILSSLELLLLSSLSQWGSVICPMYYNWKVTKLWFRASSTYVSLLLLYNDCAQWRILFMDTTCFPEISKYGFILLYYPSNVGSGPLNQTHSNIPLWCVVTHLSVYMNTVFLCCIRYIVKPFFKEKPHSSCCFRNICLLLVE